jgi:hypothetical protein
MMDHDERVDRASFTYRWRGNHHVTVERPEEDGVTTIDLRLARKGKGQPRQAVLQQARLLKSHIDGHKTALAEHGWDDDDTTRFATSIAAVESAVGERAEVSNESDKTTKNEQAALDAVKAFVRRLRLALPRVLREQASLGVTASSFAVETPWGRSTPKAIAYLIQIRSAVVVLDEPLKKHFAGKKASDVLDAVKALLEKADTDQESAQVAGPVETQALNEAVGRLLEEIEDVIRAGKSAFDGNATMAAQFNKDLILRARRHKNDAPGESPAEPPKP